ncbi:hypothetical protein MMC25_001161 [Agyrium rufum]|nr:hypothetical protein [Agyrium rufum]
MAPLTLIVNESEDLSKPIADILTPAIQPIPGGHSPISAAAEALDALLPGIDEDGQVFGNGPGWLECFWDCFHDFARQIPHDSVQADRLVDIIKALKTEIPPKYPHLREMDRSYLWAHLVYLGPTLHDSFNRMDDGAVAFPHTIAAQARQLNHQAFCARLGGAGLITHIEWLGTISVAAPLEGVMKPIRGSRDLIDPDPRSVMELPFQIARAAFWIKYAAHKWYGKDEGLVYGGGPLYKQAMKDGRLFRKRYKGAGLCPERWNLWKERFGVVACCEGVDNATTQIAREAVENMERIEREYRTHVSGESC